MWSVCLGSHGFCEYEAATNSRIEQAYKDGRSKVTVTVTEKPYIICFKEMIQHQQNDPHRHRRVRRSGSVWMADMGSQGFCAYKADANSLIEEAYLRHKSSATVMVNGQPYVVCFKTMKQHPQNHPQKCRAMRRSEQTFAAVDPPAAPPSYPPASTTSKLGEVKTHFYGTKTLCHLTKEDAARSIIASGEFFNSKAKPGYQPMFGEFIYFAGSPEDCVGKSRAASSLADGALLKAEVSLGTALICGDPHPSLAVEAFLQITSWEDLTADKLRQAKCQSVCGTQPIVSRDEYAVPSNKQVQNIRVSGYRNPHNSQSAVQPFWLWPQWVHDLATVTGVDSDDIELTAQAHSSHTVASASPSSDSTVSGVRVNIAGRPIHSNGRFMSYADARSKGWGGPAGGSQPTNERPASSRGSAQVGHGSHSRTAGNPVAAASRSSPTVGPSCRRPNAWNDYQHSRGGQGLSRQEMKGGYVTHQASHGHSHGGNPAAVAASGSSTSRRPNAWNDFQHSHGSQGLSRQEMSTGYAVHQAAMGNLGGMGMRSSGFGGMSSSSGGGGGGGGGGGSGGLGWNAFRASIGGQGHSKPEISAMYHAQK
ncbi:unnamed protein product [Polarella glacialis]|uniref:WWE domain-containing protein n=1 Tax=Polarella glacialis TaxID=89957 RepID=A0A813JGK9_POLGL|nr:unnamed protein product [Polarella glacialis]